MDILVFFKGLEILDINIAHAPIALLGSFSNDDGDAKDDALWKSTSSLPTNVATV